MDWTHLLAELKRAGLTQSEIAQRVGAPQSVISVLSTGKFRNPSFAVGFALVELHKKQVRKTARAA